MVRRIERYRHKVRDRKNSSRILSLAGKFNACYLVIVRRNQEYNEKALSGLYHSNKQARTILNELAALPKQNETLLETIEKRLKDDKDITRRGIVTFFKQLEDFGVGEFIPGRRGHSSRFRWDVDSVNVSTLDVNGLPEHQETRGSVPLPAHQDVSHSSPHALIAHKFQLRPDLIVSINLPGDITSAEAARLSQFIQSIPFV